MFLSYDCEERVKQSSQTLQRRRVSILYNKQLCSLHKIDRGCSNRHGTNSQAHRSASFISTQICCHCRHRWQGQTKTTCMKNHAFLAFLNIYTQLPFLSRKFSLSVICLPFIYLMVQQNAAIRRWRGGKAMSPSADGVATRRFAHFLHLSRAVSQSRAKAQHS